MFFVNIKSKSRPEFSDNPKKQHCQTTSTNRNKNVSILYFCTMLALQSIVLCPLALKYPVLSQNNIPVSSHENVPVPLHENS